MFVGLPYLNGKTHMGQRCRCPTMAPTLLHFLTLIYNINFLHGCQDTKKLKVLQLNSYLFRLFTGEKISALIVRIIMCVRVFERILTWGRHLVVRPD